MRWVFILCLEKQKTKAKPWSDRTTRRISFLGLSNEFAPVQFQSQGLGSTRIHKLA